MVKFGSDFFSEPFESASCFDLNLSLWDPSVFLQSDFQFNIMTDDYVLCITLPRKTLLCNFSIHFWTAKLANTSFNIYFLLECDSNPQLNWTKQQTDHFAEIAELNTTLTLSTDSSSSIGTISSFFTQPLSLKERKVKCCV